MVPRVDGRAGLLSKRVHHPNLKKVLTQFRSVYIAFDQHPSFKGASTHINHMCKVLSECYGPTLLLTVRGVLDDIRTDSIYQQTFESDEPNLLKRANAFSHWIDGLLSEQYNLQIGHFRDVWGGMAVLKHPHITPIFEVNGFPSIELPVRFPQVGVETLEKLKTLELHCLRRAAQLITPSYTIKNHIVARGIQSDKVEVIPNGATLPAKNAKHADLPKDYIVYMGALQPWQGVDTLLRSLRYLADKKEMQLVICSSHNENRSKPFRKFTEKLGVEKQVIWKYQLGKEELQQVMQHAMLSVAPLKECSRNIEQGCSPLKIFESMACGVPVVASDLPAVREIIEHNENGILVRADRPAELARGIRILLDYPDFRKNLGEKAQQTIEDRFTWTRSEQQLRRVYESIFDYSF